MKLLYLVVGADSRGTCGPWRRSKTFQNFLRFNSFAMTFANHGNNIDIILKNNSGFGTLVSRNSRHSRDNIVLQLK